MSQKRIFWNLPGSNGYQFAENDPYHNTNPETNHEKVDASTLLPLERLPESYYFYNYRYRNYGGWVMLYDGRNRFCMGITVPGNGKPHFHRDGGTLNFCMESRVRSPRLLSHQSSKSMSSSS